MTRARIGEPRVYSGPTVPILYPGEAAHAQIDPEAIFDAIKTGRPVLVTNWLVEPAPGWHNTWLRLRWRFFGRWFPRGTPKLEVVTAVRASEESE